MGPPRRERAREGTDGPPQFVNLLNRTGPPTKTRWNVRIEDARHGGVVPSRARSLRGGPIKNARLVAWDWDCVTFTYPRARDGGGVRATLRSV